MQMGAKLQQDEIQGGVDAETSGNRERDRDKGDGEGRTERD